MDKRKKDQIEGSNNESIFLFAFLKFVLCFMQQGRTNAHIEITNLLKPKIKEGNRQHRIDVYDPGRFRLVIFGLYIRKYI